MIIQQQQTTNRRTFWQHLDELEFVTAAFTWLFRLMSRVAEPLMTLATIYVIVEAGVPSVSIAWLHFLAVALMISAPEIILPGGFILAGEIKNQGNRHYKLLYTMCWIFVVLTSATLADLFIWHFSGATLAALMWSRCAAAVGYSVLFRVITYKREREVMPIAEVASMVQGLEERHAQHTRELTNQFTLQLKMIQSETLNQVRDMVQSQVTEPMQTVQLSMNGQLNELAQGFTRDLKSAMEAAQAERNTGQLRSIKNLVQSEQASEPVNVRVAWFIKLRVDEGKEVPSLTEIMEHCSCSRNSAIRYRREVLGEKVA